MKTRLFHLVSLVLVVAFLASGSAPRAIAQDRQAPLAPPPAKGERRPPGIPPSPDAGRSSGALLQATGGPDDYGYTWDDTVAFNWIDATSGIDSGLSGDDQYSAAIDIGFSFPFFENAFTQLYVNTNGLLTFGSGSSAYSNSRLPQVSPPNNLIAVFWDDLAVGQAYNSGQIYYQHGGAPPNRYFVLEWHDVTACCSRPGTDNKTFEVILHENGDIVTQWLSLPGDLFSATVGIEDSVGVSGLAYVHDSAGLGDNKAVRFSRPGPMARVQVYPPYQGQFTHAGGAVSFALPVRNTGDLGNDVYDLSASSGWPLSFYDADGMTPLTDTDSDGTVDTGALPQAQGRTIVARIQSPGGAAVGDAVAASVTVRSSLDTGRSRTVTLQTAIPAPFAQVYRDDYDGTMSLYLAQAGAQQTKKAAENWWGYDPAVAEAPSGDFAYLWKRGRCLTTGCVLFADEIEYTLLNRFGETVRGVSKLTDHSNATMTTHDVYPAVAAAPDGHIGVLWYRYLYQYVNNESLYNYNIFFAILDASGNVAYGPENLTQNAAWGDPWTNPDVPSFDSPQIAAAADNRFVLAWHRQQRASGCSGTDCDMNDVYYAVRASNGSQVRGVTRFTNDITGPSYEGYFAPRLTELAGSRALITWYRYTDHDVYYAVLDSAGNVVKDKANLSGDGANNFEDYRDAAQLPDGKIVVAWTGWHTSANIRFAVLDTAFNRVAGPTDLSNPASTSGDAYVSVTADPAGHAVLTWMDYDSYSQRNLYYALIDGNGGILTPPMIFRTSQASSPSIQTSVAGYGSTSYGSAMATGVDGAVWPSAASVRAVPGGAATIDVHYANHGQTSATAVVLRATVPNGWSYLGDTSGLGPTIVGNVVTWQSPDLGFLDERQFTFQVGVPGTATIGPHYLVTLELGTHQAETNPSDNSAGVDVLVVSQVYLPLVRKR